MTLDDAIAVCEEHGKLVVTPRDNDKSLNEEIIDVGSKAGAIRVAASLRRIDDFALAIVRGPFVVRRVAKSQSRRAMNKQEFAASKSAIMEVIAGLIGVAPDQLGKAA